MGAIKFGTDGWRAVIAEDFTFANLDRVAQATADYWRSHPVDDVNGDRAIVGYDRRFLSEQFAARVAEVLAGNGFIVTLTDRPTPTPSVSFEVKRQKAIGGVMLTASHNPAIFNGFKQGLVWRFGGTGHLSGCRGSAGSKPRPRHALGASHQGPLGFGQRHSRSPLRGAQKAGRFSSHRRFWTQICP
jgi:hypothetical protein